MPSTTWFKSSICGTTTCVQLNVKIIARAPGVPSRRLVQVRVPPPAVDDPQTFAHRVEYDAELLRSDRLRSRAHSNTSRRCRTGSGDLHTAA
jgi:hypothetical protein